jgi:hypothetical protein
MRYDCFDVDDEMIHVRWRETLIVFVVGNNAIVVVGGDQIIIVVLVTSATENCNKDLLRLTSKIFPEIK